jgi:ribonucleotide reductase beta subunit family protein with ferritin-like domain
VSVREVPRRERDVSSSDELELQATPYDALYAHWERHQWSALAIDLSTDRASFKRLGERECEGLLWIFANRFHAEFNVARLLAPFLIAAPNWELQCLLATQTADEHRHLELVLRIYEEVFGVQGGIEAVQQVADRGLDAVSKTLLYDKLDEWVLPLDTRRDEDSFLQAILVYHLLGEGVIARTGQNLAARRYADLPGFPGLIEGQRHVARDEARHIGIGVTYLRSRIVADPGHTRELVQEVLDDLLPVAAAMLERANGDLRELSRSGYGVDPDAFYGEVMRLLSLRLRSIGFSEDQRSQPPRWTPARS